MKQQQNMQEDRSVELASLQDKIFVEKNGKIYIGGKEIKKELLDILREQAFYLKSSQLFEILVATMVNESFNIGVLNSKDFNAVLSAKMLHHWNFVMVNLINTLSKK